MEFTKVVAERYSCKNFSTRKVEAEKLTEILEAGRLAPTAKNFQEQRVYVLQSEGKPGKARQGDALPLWRAYLPRRGLR
ncbi:nitroreductase family protein [Faecalibacterium prausnitzii]|uniref:nitroreductase family protein n=1 Tax=Faecalibacterium prausnitzii TaxID=853 RepID=UPI00325B5100